MKTIFKLAGFALATFMLFAVGFSAYAEMKANAPSGATVEYTDSQSSFANEISKAF